MKKIFLKKICNNQKSFLTFGVDKNKDTSNTIFTMENNFDKVKNYLLDLEYSIVKEDAENGIFVISKETEGIKNMVLVCADPILVLEQPMFELKNATAAILEALLKKNREIVHGAFAIDDNNRVIFRDTLELENLDLNELEGSLNSLTMLLSEYGAQLVEFAK